MADHLHAIPDGSRRSGTLLDDIRYESDGVFMLLLLTHACLATSHLGCLGVGFISRTRRAVRKEPLLLAMLAAVLVGVLGGSLARRLHPSDREIELLGELLGVFRLT